jgi:adenosylcobyric acid synthase
MRVMFLGTSSGAGKSVITAVTCRHLHRQGVKVAPFKTLNLSLNSYVTPDGRELGMAQAFQSWACGLEPDVRMNPILLKPSGPGRMQAVLQGLPWKDLDAAGDGDREHMMKTAMRDFRSLSQDYEAMVLEGSGSPVELNLRQQDIANMRTARETGSPVVIVGDIDRGGVFAGILGTHALLDDNDRPRARGFIINRFRGDASILAEGIQRLEDETGMRHLGTMPCMDLRLPQEDSMFMGARGRLGEEEDIRLAWMRNLDLLTDAAERHLDFDMLEGIMREKD